MEKLSKRALGCMYTAAIIWAILGVSILVAINVVWFIPDNMEIGTTISIVLAVLLVANAAISPYFRFHRYRYSINDEFIDIYEGYIFVERNIVPLERLHKMQTLRGPIDRMFKVAKVVVTTAGGDVTLRFLDEEKAEFIAESLGRRINQIVVEKREKDGE
ncbi:MAG: PH domain-containing protein [Agathobacter sp.]|nr:PH domain-containing protein [Agathobacter sp.]